MSWLRPVVDTPGPIASVHLDATHVTETAEQELELRWAEAREQLEAVPGVPAKVGRALYHHLNKTGR